MKTVGVSGLVAGAASLGASSPALAVPTVVAVESASSPISVYGQTVVWSSKQLDGSFVLRVYRAGIVRTLPVRSRHVPFDVDLGPDTKGRTVAVYSRCRVENRVTDTGCKLFRYRLGGREARIKGVSRRKYSEHDPTIWRSRIAFARYRDPSSNETSVVDRVYLRSDGRVRELPRGTAKGEEIYSAGAQHLDLRGQRLAFAWFYFGFSGCQTTPDSDPYDKLTFDPVQRQIWLVDAHQMRRKIDSGCEYDSNQVFDPSLGKGGLRYQHERPGPPYFSDPYESGGTQSTELRTVNGRGKRLATRALPDAVANSAATDSILATSRFVASSPGAYEGTFEITIDAHPAGA